MQPPPRQQSPVRTRSQFGRKTSLVTYCTVSHVGATYMAFTPHHLKNNFSSDLLSLKTCALCTKQCCGSEIIIFGSGFGFNFGSGFGSGLHDKSYKTLPNLSSRKHRSKILQPLQKMIIEHRSSRFYNLIFLHQLKFELQII